MIRDREEYDRLARELEILRAAVAKARACETCAAAMVVEGRCPVHDVRFRRGERVEPDR